MTQEELRSLLSRYHLKPNKAFGQNFLMNDAVLESMLKAAKVTHRDTVLEIGPGIGNLTRLLALQAGLVVAIEKDLRFKELLQDLEKKQPNVRVRFADALQYNIPTELARVPAERISTALDALSYKVVANIPYYVTGKLVQLFLRSSFRPKSITVLVQKEVAENIVAKPGNTNLLSLSVQLLATARIVEVVPASDFYPAPKVDSAVVHMELFSESPYGTYDEKAVFRVAKACFSGKRKQIHNSLAAGLRLSVDQTRALLDAAGVAPTARPQDLSVAQFLDLSKALL